MTDRFSTYISAVPNFHTYLSSPQPNVDVFSHHCSPGVYTILHVFFPFAIMLHFPKFYIFIEIIIFNCCLMFH